MVQNIEQLTKTFDKRLNNRLQKRQTLRYLLATLLRSCFSVKQVAVTAAAATAMNEVKETVEAIRLNWNAFLILQVKTTSAMSNLGTH